MKTMSDIEKFISRFHSSDNIDEVFTNGCCYWFAYILFVRFLDIDAQIMYDKLCNHFATKIGDRIFDITGDVTDMHEWEPWSDFDDELHKQRIIRDCVRF